MALSGAALFYAVVNTGLLLQVALAINRTLPVTALEFLLVLAPTLLLSLGLSFFLASLGVYLRCTALVVPVLVQILSSRRRCSIPRPRSPSLLLDRPGRSPEPPPRLGAQGAAVEPVARVGGVAGGLLVALVVLLLGYAWFQRRGEGFPMSSDGWDPQPAISVRDVGKSYQIYAQPRDRLLQGLFRGRRTLYREFWALRQWLRAYLPGESLGIIGRNGSGRRHPAGRSSPARCGRRKVKCWCGASSGPCSNWAVASTRIHRPRECVHAGGRARILAGRDRRALRRHRPRALPTSATSSISPVKNLQHRHVRAPRVRRAGTTRARHPDCRRGPGGRRRCSRNAATPSSRRPAQPGGGTFLSRPTIRRRSARSRTARCCWRTGALARAARAGAARLPRAAAPGRVPVRPGPVRRQAPEGRASEAPAVAMRESAATAQLAFGDLDAEIEEFAILDGEDQPASTFYPGDPMRFRVGVRAHRALTHLNIGLRNKGARRGSRSTRGEHSTRTSPSGVAAQTARRSGTAPWRPARSSR